MKSIIEGLESFTNVPRYTSPVIPTPSSPTPITTHSVNAYTHSFCDRLRPEQKTIINYIQQGDVFVNMSAGGGKSLPFICHWLNNLLEINVIHSTTASHTPIHQLHQLLTCIYILLS